MNKQITVFVGLSGGVDSSVAALRLLKQGYKVVGVFIKVWHPDFLVCNWEAERLDAMRVAAKLGIPFLTCDAINTYRDAVAKYFIESYQAGRTPNPDVMCNKEVKFGVFMDFAKKRGADFVATGHYAQNKFINGKHWLARGVDTNKDQSYFLWTLTQSQLKHILFPVGNSSKDVIRKEATKAGLITAQKKDSQGVCFLGHIDIPDFLSHYIDLKPGHVLDEVGNVVGEHQGAFVYTIGQRHGFTLNSPDSNRGPHYVVEKDLSKNHLVVSAIKPIINTKENLTLSEVQLNNSLPKQGEILAQTRYRQNPFSVTVAINNDKDKLLLTINETTEVPAIGQSCVLYQGEIVLGGGIIS
ncbi:tRNA 2-thiouridine(34) synthase MnmA [Candidatus Kaiserbacteria bacterium RIFOXYD1_FULL_42_15]|uniref:tRNA-specific 2-thiouridylase MnmA n=1 Tax=Candidatus Kaiserbacteria bacterium RIFOXYD1_FULL_42_15 TaxID=1798532 RepID=A0A1F6FR28_9BACT|nr:MAG: tRNA 2-thiouridine(34) synthase MnmA [Candidatus Kaiserbacteria bacterium RIFOXYD1_FULL_42_15]